jgi:hypothetical protein
MTFMNGNGGISFAHAALRGLDALPPAKVARISCGKSSDATWSAQAQCMKALLTGKVCRFTGTV